nr:imm68 putative immunity domain-containing protein [uncultured Acetatifactor sp.]
MGAWGVKAWESDEGQDVIHILENEYVPEHPVMELGEIIDLMREEVMLGADFSQIDFLFDNTAMALAELYFRWKDEGRLDLGHGDSPWNQVTDFTASKKALACLLRQLTHIKNQVPDEDGIRESVELWKKEDSGEVDPAWWEHLNRLIERLISEWRTQKMYIKKYWGNYIGGTDDSLNLIEFLKDQDQDEISLSEIFAKIGLDKQNWDFHQTVEYLVFTYPEGWEMDFHFAIDLVTDLAAILLECSVNGAVDLHDLDEYITPSRLIRVTATPEEHAAMNRALSDFVRDSLSYDLHELVPEEDMLAMAEDCENLRQELYGSGGCSPQSPVPGGKGAEPGEKDTEPGGEGAEPDGKDAEPGGEGAAPGGKGAEPGGKSPMPSEKEPLPHPVETAQDKEQKENLLEQCQRWNAEDRYQEIIHALEAIPAEERTPEMDSELARAYNNWGTLRSDWAALKKAIALLTPHEEYFSGDHFWNFRMGYAYYYLDQEGRALPYFRRALEACPDDEDTREMIGYCEERIALPQFAECFRELTVNWWETFAEQEAKLRRMMDEDKEHLRGAEIAAQMEEVLHLAFNDISFEIGCNGEKHELILTPEGDKVKLFQLAYFRSHAPEKVLQHWNILVGRQPNPDISLRTDLGWEVSGEDVQIWLEERGENTFALSAYCQKLLPMLREEENRVWWAIVTLTDQMLGEIPHMRYIDSLDVLEAPREEPSIPLTELPHKLRELGLDLSTDPKACLESYLGYKMTPNEDRDADWRLDTIAGSTCCAPLINGYLNADNYHMDNLHADGAVACFLCYPLCTLQEEEGSQKIFDFRDSLEEALTAGDGAEALTLTGGATGIYCGYVDFIAWDLPAALDRAETFFKNTHLPWANFHTFRREAATVPLKRPEEDAADIEELEETLTGMDYALCHIESIEEKGLAIDPINAYNHMAIYLRWCMEHDLMGDEFLEEYSDITEQTKARPGNTDLRTFIREELSGCLHSALFNRQGQAFAQYYYGENDQPYYPADIDDYALEYFGKARYHSDEFQEEAYLFLPFDEDYYQAMAKVIQRRFTNWQSQDFDEDTLEPSELAQAMMKYLDCECTYFPSMRDDDPIMSAYRYARRLGVREGFIPLLVKVDETLWECLVLNTDPENDGADDYAFQPEKVAKYREKMLAAPVKDGKAVLEELIGQRKEDVEDDDMDWEEVLGEMEEDAQPDTEDELNTRFASYWCERTQMTCPLILAKIPVKNPWEIFAYLPFGNWNDCPDTPELMAAAKYWFQQHGAVPAAMTHDELEFHLPAPVPGNEAMEVAVEQYGLCPDMDQNFEEIAALADTLRRSTVWYFWWD